MPCDLGIRVVRPKTNVFGELNVALNRMSNDVPEALLPDEEHIVLYPDVVSTDATVVSRVVSLDGDKRLLEFVDTQALKLMRLRLRPWKPTVTGEGMGRCISRSPMPRAGFTEGSVSVVPVHGR